MVRLVGAGVLVTAVAFGSGASAQAEGDIVHMDVDVYVNDSEWARPPISVSIGDLIVIRARQTVEAKRNGRKTTWVRPVVSLQIDGTAEQDAASGVSRVVSHDGQLELRIRNKRYVRSSTPVRVNVLVVPGSLVPKARHHKTEPPADRSKRTKRPRASRRNRPSRVKVGGAVALGRNGNPASIARQIRTQHVASIRRCHQQLLQQDPKAGGKVTIRLTLGPTGSVTKSSVKAFDATVAGCIKGLTKKWSFGKQTGAPQFAIALILKPGP